MNQKVFNILQKHYTYLPHCRAIGLKYERAEDGAQIMSVDWQLELVGNQQSQVIHGGVITTLVDVTGALAVAYQLDQLENLATLDLRIDYMRPAVIEQKIYAYSECYQLSGQVAFVRSTCYQSNRDDPVAIAIATYMRSSIDPNLLKKNRNE